MSDESLREFQLNGKQLVFLFMASTIVAVVIFLCGVMVGRGVSTAQAAVSNSTVETGDPTAGNLAEPTPAAPLTPPSDVAPEVPGEEPNLTYSDTLKGEKRNADLSPATPPSKPAAAAPKTAVAGASGEKPAASSTVAKAEVAKPTAVKFTPPAASAPAPARDSDAEPAGNGFVVQVAATPKRSEADAIRSRLQSKGYPAFVTTSGSLFRVRVGKYDDRAKADSVAKRLETEERFKPWVTR